MYIKVRSCDLKTISSKLTLFIIRSLVQTKHTTKIYRFHPTRAQQDNLWKSGDAGISHKNALVYIPRGSSGIDLEFTWLLVRAETGWLNGWDLRCSGALMISFPNSLLLFLGIESFLKCGMLSDSFCQFSFVARQIAEATRVSASLQVVAVLPAIVGAMWISAASTVTRV